MTCSTCRPDKKNYKKYWKVGIKLSKNTFQYKILCILTLPKCDT